eukprot:gene41262-55806_t
MTGNNPTQEELDKQFLDAAYEEAQQGLSEGGIPIGSVLVRNGEIIGRGHNRRVQNGDPILLAGYPGRTSRYKLPVEIRNARDSAYPLQAAEYQ